MKMSLFYFRNAGLRSEQEMGVWMRICSGHSFSWGSSVRGTYVGYRPVFLYLDLWLFKLLSEFSGAGLLEIGSSMGMFGSILKPIACTRGVVK